MKNTRFQKVLRWLAVFLIVIYPFSPLSNNLLVSNAVDTTTETEVPETEVPELEVPELGGNEDTYTLNYQVANGNMGTVVVQNISNQSSIDSGDPVIEGNEVQLTAIAEEGYVFYKWEGIPDGLAEDIYYHSAIFPMPDNDLNITARFIGAEPTQQLNLGVSPQGAGTVNGMATFNTENGIEELPIFRDEPYAVLQDGAFVELVASTENAETYTFSHWEPPESVSEVEINENKISFYMGIGSGQDAVTAVFQAVDTGLVAPSEYNFTLAVDPSEGGVVKDIQGSVVKPGTIIYNNSNDALNYKAEPNPGYKFKNWEISLPEGAAEGEAMPGWYMRLINPLASIQLDSNNILSPQASGFTLTAVFEKEAEGTVAEPTTDSQPTHTTFPKTSDELNFSPYVITMMLSAGMYFFLKTRVGKSNKKA